jgi:hypothetical protein
MSRVSVFGGVDAAGLGSGVHHLTQVELSRRWRVSPRTLEGWRWLGEGPRYLKIGGRVVYRLEDVEAWEAARLRASTAAGASDADRG